MNFNQKKYKDLIMYILYKCHNKPNFGKTVLCSMLYFIDYNYYKIYGKLLTNETYIKSKKGIQPKHFYEISSELIRKKQLFLKKEPYYNRTIHKYHLTILPNTKFNSKELRIINSSIKKLSNNNATSITRYARKNPLINVTELGETIDFNIEKKLD